MSRGRYRLISQLTLPENQRGQGAAWLAVDTSSPSQMHVVIREIVAPARDLESRTQMVRFAVLRLSEAAQHGGFPRVLDIFNEQNNSFVVLQHLEGESLASLLRRQGGALPERAVAEYGRQLCEMLVLLSRQQPPIVHGAISPETVMVSPDRTRVHLLYLPLFPPEEPLKSNTDASYKSPEQVRNQVDPSSDLYAVAATMHHAVTGSDPHGRIAFFYPLARRLNPELSPRIETILAQGLRLSPTQRYLRAADMQKDLTILLTKARPEAEKEGVRIEPDPLDLDVSEMRQRSHQRSLRQLSFFACICLVILLVAVFFMGVYPSLTLARQSATASPTPDATATVSALNSALSAEWQVEATTYKADQVALSDGRYVFDTYSGLSAQDLTYKKQAAQALLNNDLNTAFSDYGKAVALDPADGEARIYYEDLRIEREKLPYMTIVLGLPIDKGTQDLQFTRPDLRAAYVFQSEVNLQNLLPKGVKLRILLGDSGGQAGGATIIAQYVANRVQIGNLEHIVAVVGWPTNEASSNASAILTAAKVPLIAQTASGISLNNLSSYFFRVSPNDMAQGKIQGQFAYQELGARTAVVLRDPNDPYSVSLATAFTSSFEALGGKVIDHATDHFTEYTTTVAQYEQQAVRDALNNHANLIFMPGYDEDAIRLAHALGQMSLIYPFYLTNVKILGGDAVDTSLVLGSGTSADALLAQQYPQEMQRLRFTSFSDASEWSGLAQSQQPAFLVDWSKSYSEDGLADAALPTNDALMTADAFGVLIYASKLVIGPLNGASLRNALASIGTNSIPVYKGLSGSLAFGSDGNPVNKPLVFLEVAYDTAIGANAIQLVPTTTSSGQG